MKQRLLAETRKCRRSLHYFLCEYGWIYDAVQRDWLRFRLWPAQWQVASDLLRYRQIVILKARQLGLSWLVLGYALWRMLFHPSATVLIFSRRQEEAEYLLGEERLRGMFRRLPLWMRLPEAVREARDCWMLANGSVARAFPSNAGDSYTATLAILDEADLVPDLDRLLRSVKPTIDAGGQIVVLSRVNKSQPHSTFQRLYQEARTGRTDWHAIFLPWQARPDRDEAWYAAIRRDILARTGSLDELYEQYPASDAEALAPRQCEKRFPLEWLLACYQELPPVSLDASQGDPARFWDHFGSLLTVYRWPHPQRRYVIGADPAEGNPQSDESAAVVLELATQEEVAVLAGRAEPAVFAERLAQLAKLYGQAPVLVERNQHGHAVLLWWMEHASRLAPGSLLPPLLPGPDGRPGWLTTTASKAALWTRLAERLRQQQCCLHHRRTLEQLASIEGATLRAPAGQADDLAIAFALALVAADIVASPATIHAGGQTIVRS